MMELEAEPYRAMQMTTTRRPGSRCRCRGHVPWLSEDPEDQAGAALGADPARRVPDRPRRDERGQRPDHRPGLLPDRQSTWSRWGSPRSIVTRYSGSLRPDDNDTVATAVRGRQNFNVSQDVPDDSLQYVRYIETIVRLDRDEDGIAERYRAIMLGDGPEPLALLPGDDCYYIVASPYRRPHEPIGNGAVEEAIDLQDQMTALVRGWINNMNRANEPREIVSSSDLIGYE